MLDKLGALSETGSKCQPRNTSMIVYFGIYGSLCLAALSVAGKRDQVFVLGVFLTFLCWFMGSRYYVGCDFTSYLQRFELFVTPSNMKDLIQRPEWGYEMLVWFVKILDLDFVWTNMAAAAAYAAGFFTLFRRQPASLYMLAAAFPVMMIQLGMSGTRQCLAVAFLMFSYEQFRKKSMLGTAAFILIAMQFHTSAIIFLPLAYLAGRQVSTAKIVGAMVVLGPVAALLLADRFSVYTDRYIDDRYGALDSDGALFRYVLILIPAILFVKYRKLMEMQFPRDYNLMKVISLATFAILPIAIVNTTILHRLIYYLMPVSIITFVCAGSFVFGRKSLMLGRAFPILIFGAYMLSWFALSRHADVCFTPYQSYTFQ